MSVKTAKLQFNGGELSPWLAGRLDIAKYNQTAKLCRNFLPLTEGSLKRRGGTRFVAKTPEKTGVSLTITADPAEAKILINGVIQNTLKVAEGDTVFYEVEAKGYVTTRGKYTVIENTTLEINLVSLSERKSLTLSVTPNDATVKIADYPRTFYRGYKNEKVSYLVYKNDYAAVAGTVTLDSDKTIAVTLTAHSEDEGSYGSWGTPLSFMGCSVYGFFEGQKKCLLIRFSNGYLPVIFDAYKIAPDENDVDESLFILNPNDGYNAVVFYQEQNCLAVIRRGKDAVFYDNLFGSAYSGFMIDDAWQRDANGDVVTIFQAYDGHVVGKTIKVYYQGQLVWSLKGRNNG